MAAHPPTPISGNLRNNSPGDLLVYLKQGYAFKDEIKNSIDPTSSIQFFRGDPIQCHEMGYPVRVICSWWLLINCICSERSIQTASQGGQQQTYAVLKPS